MSQAIGFPVLWLIYSFWWKVEGDRNPSVTPSRAESEDLIGQVNLLYKDLVPSVSPTTRLIRFIAELVKKARVGPQSELKFVIRHLDGENRWENNFCNPSINPVFGNRDNKYHSRCFFLEIYNRVYIYIFFFYFGTRFGLTSPISWIT